MIHITSQIATGFFGFDKFNGKIIESFLILQVEALIDILKKHHFQKLGVGVILVV